MNANQRLYTWASQWTAHRAIAAQPLDEPQVPPFSERTETDNAFTVAGGSDLATMLLDRLTSSVAPDDAEKAERSGAYTVSPSGGRVPHVPISAGQIRQLNPALNPTWSRSVLVLVLAVDEERALALAAPFGEFGEPAFEGELSTGLRDASMSVLCIWNAAWVPLDAVRRSWWLTDAVDSLLSDALSLHKARSQGHDIPAQLKDRVGTPIIHPLDPRHDYMDLEAGLLNDLSV